MPAPAKIDDAGVKAWVDRYDLDGDDWTYIAWSKGGAVFLRNEYVDSTEYPLIRYWLKTEMFLATYLEDRGFYRSLLQQHEADCRRERFKTLSITAYEAPNLGKEIGEETEDEPPWEPAKPGTVGSTIVASACLVGAIQEKRDRDEAAEPKAGFN